MKKPLRILTIALITLALPVAVACSSNESSSTPTSASSPSATAASATTTAPPSTATSAASPSAPASPTNAPAAEGTVDPLGAGQQTPWTVKPPKEPVTGNATLAAVRMGVHPEQGGWERIVFEFTGDAWPPATVQYVDKATNCAKGDTVTVEGTAILEVAMTNAQAHNDAGKATVQPQITGPGTTVSGGIQSCDFEGHVTWDFGLNGKHNFKVSTLPNPPRIVIDVKQ